MVKRSGTSTYAPASHDPRLPARGAQRRPTRARVASPSPPPPQHAVGAALAPETLRRQAGWHRRTSREGEPDRFQPVAHELIVLVGGVAAASAPAYAASLPELHRCAPLLPLETCAPDRSQYPPRDLDRRRPAPIVAPSRSSRARKVRFEEQSGRYGRSRATARERAIPTVTRVETRRARDGHYALLVGRSVRNGRRDRAFHAFVMTAVTARLK